MARLYRLALATAGADRRPCEKLSDLWQGETRMAIRTAKAQWNGNLMEGNGTMALGSGAYQGAYSFSSRFEDAKGTNPEELIAAAHAGCFSMALSGQLSEAGFTAKSVTTTRRST